MIGSTTVRRGFTMIELFGVLILLTVMIMLLLPAVQSAREMARRTSCANNLLQVSTGMQMYHAAFERLPEQLSGTDGSIQPGLDNDRRLSVFVALLPFLGQPEIVDAMSKSLTSASQPMEGEYGGYGEYWMGMSEADSESDFGSSEDSELEKSLVWPAGGPEPFDGRYWPWRIEMSVYRCPSDPGIGIPAMARINYAACLGDAVLTSDSGPMKQVAGTFVIDADLQQQTEAAMRGALVPRVVTRYSDVTDGLANTILLGEIATDLGDLDCRTFPMAVPDPNLLRDRPAWAFDSGVIDPDRPRFWVESSVTTNLEATVGARRGFRWADGMPVYTAMNTILPPNREIVLAMDRDDTWGILPPSSRHQGGAHVASADGAVRFISDHIDAGDPNRPSVYLGSTSAPLSESPYGIWGAMGTRNGHELISGKLVED